MIWSLPLGIAVRCRKRLEAFGLAGDVRGLGTRLIDRVDHRLRVRWLSHPVGQFIYAIEKVRTIATKLLKQCDHLGDLLLAQDRQLQIEEPEAFRKAVVPSLRREDQYDQIEGR
jgi:hypothetical protein